MLLEIALVLISVLFFLNLYLSWNDNYWLEREVPFLEPSKGYGNIKDVILLRKTVGEVYTDIYRRLEGRPWGGFFRLRTPVLLVRSTGVVESLLQDQFEDFHDNDIQIMRHVDPIFKMNPYVTRGATWKALRTVIEPCNRPDKIQKAIPLMHEVCHNLIRYIENKQNLPIEVKELSGRYVTDVVGSVVFGQEVNSFLEEEPFFRRMTGKVFNAGLASTIALLCAFYAPLLGNIFKFRIIPKDVADYFIELVKETCRQRVKNNITRDDFLQDMININKESEVSGEGTVYDYSEIAAHCITFLTGGYYTSASSLCFCLYELANNPECQEKLRRELQERVDRPQTLSYAQLASLPYLDIFVKESLRLHPPIQTMSKVCTRATVLHSGEQSVELAGGTPVVVGLAAMHRDPQLFANPQAFLPERFLTDTSSKAYLPFGHGPRACPASNLATALMKVALVWVVLNFEVRLEADHQELALDPKQSFLTTAKGDLNLFFTKLQ